ncbi:magnesium protoporphyrin IX methyltransferase [Paracraurococcus ruber]|uniref:Magnesium protoporphyrin IX methyltransferase n=1 Tax=Paracraurococcus ruber TaxID=77675 RepID=A0ABS1D4G6_9PROT|nr:magnesium protoporphyrin IX methyltransferase [Paracraurococcus ruber]MBK1661441.1 magnesium protoporphyrin IX methyltransferase [Paracraurococcus ruber]TDG32849.1 magnesium protoporphyrin IX methyltransferase [Paracraurococcus ruber]
MPTATYADRRQKLEHYFDRTAVEAWKRLTSDAPVSGIRATVREGRDRMRATLLDWLPADLTGRRILDAGCGTGALAVAAARRGAQVVAVDLSPNLVSLAQERIGADHGRGHVEFRVGDMFDPALGRFDHVVGMDSLIHYGPADVVRVLAGLASRTDDSMLFTFAPSTAFLQAFLAVGRLVPRGDRSPAIVPVAEHRLRRRIEAEPALRGWRTARTQRIARGFYTSQALEVVRA